MKIYNTLSHQVEEFIPYEEGKVKMYTCGPTVYNYAHIGNLRTYIFEDILEKTLRYLGYEVLRCMNITDVGHLTSDSDSGEDKMVKGAKKENKTVLEIAKFYTDAFKKDTEKLNIKWPEIVSPATENISVYFKIIERLLEKDLAYISGGNVYFDTSKLDDYYQLTNHRPDEMVVGVREGVEEDNNKGKHVKDTNQDFTTQKTNADIKVATSGVKVEKANKTNSTQPQQKAKALPNTGNANTAPMLYGTIFAGLGTAMMFGMKRRKNEN